VGKNKAAVDTEAPSHAPTSRRLLMDLYEPHSLHLLD
jgi:hypothetical protein